jgi:hypothetical protein
LWLLDIAARSMTGDGATDVTIGIDKIRDHQMLKFGPCTEGDWFLLYDPRSTGKMHSLLRRVDHLEATVNGHVNGTDARPSPAGVWSGEDFSI